jgi:hypothetical protein
MIASFRNLTLLARGKFPKLAITAAALPKYRDGRTASPDDLRSRPFEAERRTRNSTQETHCAGGPPVGA